MFEVMQGFPEEVLAVRATGRIGTDDYRDMLVPEVARRIEQHRSLRLLLYLGPQFEGMTPGAMWADAKLGVSHWGDFGRMAVVTDVEWITNAVRLFAPLFHHPVRAFPNAQLEEARRWIAQSDA